MAAYWLFFGVAVLTLSGVSGQYYDFLYSNLLNNPPSPTLPKPNGTAIVTVHMGLSVRRLRQVDRESLMVDMDTWISLKWSNPMFNWMPEAYNGIQKLSMSLDPFWRPDITLYDSAYDVTYSSVNAVVTSSGNFHQNQPARIRTMCDNGTAGSIVCEMQFGSWTYSLNDLDLQFDPNNGFDVSQLKENSKWRLAEHSKRRVEFKDECCTEKYATVLYKFTFIPRE